MLNIIWQSYDPNRSGRLYGDQVYLNDVFEQNFEQRHSDGFEEFFELKDNDGAIVVISLDHNEQYIKQLNRDIKKLPWCLLIVTSNEYASKSYRKLKHPNLKIWLQSADEDDEADRFIGFGYPAKVTNRNQERIHDWFFAGQITHDRRKEWAKELWKIPNGIFVGSSGFNEGLEFDEYEKLLNTSKVVPCPAGPETPDTFRLYEALEAGCIPIIDMRNGKGFYRKDYWSKIFKDCPIAIINSVLSIDEVMKYELDNYEQRLSDIQEWWKKEKERLLDDLNTTIQELRNNI